MTGDADGLWIRRGDVWAGALVGGVAVAHSFHPSLIPRSTANQALVSGVAGAGGFALGNATYGWFARSDRPGADAATVAAAGILAAVVRSRCGPRSGEHMGRAVLRSATDGLVVGSAGAATVVGVRASRQPVRTAVLVAASGIAVGATRIAQGIRAQLRHRGEHDPPPPRPLPAVAQSVTIGGALAAAVNGFRHSGRAASRVLVQRVGLAPDNARIVGHGVAVAAWGSIGIAFADTFLKGMALYDRVVDPGYDRAPTADTRSAGPSSALAFSRSGRHGRRFVLDVPDTVAIEAVTGRAAVCEPVRVFVGYDAARSATERVRLAVAELWRTGAFERSILVVGSPAGTGWVNTLAFETVDLLTGGDSAGVAIQYERLPSILALQRVSDGGRHHRLLLEAIATELESLAPHRRPRLLVYGESLGAWAGQNAFLHRGVEALDELGVDRALWVGTPYYSGWWRQTLGDRTATTDGAVVAVGGPADLAALDPEVRSRLRVVLLANPDDPIPKLGAHLLVQRPRWLGDDRHPSLPAEQTFLPMLTGVQTVVDAVNATNPTPGVFRATGHDYRATLPRVVQLAYGLDDPGPEVWDRLHTHLETAEAQRAARFAPPHRQRSPRTHS